jgi:hypothetical protein
MAADGREAATAPTPPGTLVIIGSTPGERDQRP